MATETSEQPKPESQKERWVKYGANVGLTVVVAILLSILVIYIAQRNNERIDTTASGAYSLKPQTVNIIKDNKQKITLVSLYTHPEGAVAEEKTDFITPVVDLLEEYKRKGSNIDVEIIDPIRNPTKVDNLIDTVAKKYGGEVEKYKSYLDEYPKVYEQIKQLAAAEAEKVKALPLDQITSQDLASTLVLTIATVQQFPPRLEELQDQIQRRLQLKPPDYKGATESVDSSMQSLSSMLDEIIRSFKESKDDQKVPQAIRAYMTASLPTYEQMKKLADEQVEKIKNLGELKLDDLRQSLRARDAILVMGEKDMRVIGRDQVWQVDPDRRALMAGGQVKPRFAGEQQISTAILALTSEKKPKVVFMRPGGGPLTTPGFPPFQAGGPLSDIAQRLRDYNFEVLEKDLSGQWAMQAQMRGMPAEPEPSDEDIKDAIWVVLGVPAPQQQQQMMMPPPSLGPKLKEHLDAGGSAMVMFLPHADPMSEALAPWGVTVKPEVIAVHELVEQQGGRTGDMIEEAQRIPFIFVLHEYGDHEITRPLRSLDGLLIPMVLVQTEPKDGFEATPIIPIPTTPPAWGESDAEAALDGRKVEFNAPAQGGNDYPPPIYAGAAVERSAGGRLVVLGSLQFVTNDFLSIPDMEFARAGEMVSRFPANGELFTNSIFWLSKMETMIAISPSAMEVSRIEPMSDTALKAWRIGVLLVGLPLAVVVGGMLVYFARRD